MNGCLSHYLLLADRTRLQHLARGFRPSEKQGDLHQLMLGLAILAGIAAALWLAARLLDRRRTRPPVNRPLGLFLSLCRIHGLKWSERWLLWRVARSQRLRDPGRLFLEPERLDPNRLGAALRSRAVQLVQLRQRLFAESADQ